MKDKVMLVAVVVVSYLMIIAQRSFEGGHFHFNLPEQRYTIQVLILLIPFLVALVGKWKNAAKGILPAAVCCCAIYQGVMIVKAHLPWGRRAAFYAASEWAIEKIRADYRGPAVDLSNPFNAGEYHRPNRPVVSAHNPRVGYLLGGRDQSMRTFGKVDLPDYWVTGHFDEAFPKYRDRFELMDSLSIGKRTFGLYKKVK